jgi:deoxyribonuclease V
MSDEEGTEAPPGNIAIVDVQYSDARATAAGLIISHWSATSAIEERFVSVADVAAYVPGEFYKRELPCIAGCLDSFASDYAHVVIDGYVHLGMDQRPGLGMHLWRHLKERCSVVGVAKNEFKGTPVEARLLRGSSAKPLFISAVGMSLPVAKACIAAMAGDHRIPWAIKRADSLARSAVISSAAGRPWP